MTWISSQLSTLQQNISNRQNVKDASLRLHRAGQELATGLRYDVYKDLGPTSAVTLSLRSKVDQIEALKNSNGVLSNKISVMLKASDNVRQALENVFSLVTVNQSKNSSGIETLQLQASETLQSVTVMLNQNYGGVHLFAGNDSAELPVQAWSKKNTATGYSPEEVVKSVTGSGPSSVAEVTSIVAELKDIYNSENSENPDTNFERTFFNGSALEDTNGDPNTRVTARIETSRVLEFGVQANDDPFREILRGLAMLSAIDPSSIEDEDAYRSWMSEINSTLASGISGALDVSTKLGFYQQVIEDTISRQIDLSFVYQEQINNFESIDHYTAATELSAMESQLQAAYTISNRISKLSILNFN